MNNRESDGAEHTARTWRLEVEIELGKDESVEDVWPELQGGFKRLNAEVDREIRLVDRLSGRPEDARND